MRRAVRACLSTIAAAAGPSSAASSKSNVDTSQFTDLLGPEASAASLAGVLAPTAPTIKVPDELAKAHCKGLPYHLQAELPVWTLLAADTAVARKVGRVPFTFVDLTSKALLPPWLPLDAVGGRAQLGLEEARLDPTASVGNLAALGAALKSAMAAPRFFRSLPQWAATFLRYAPVVVAAEQFTWPTVLAHQSVVFRLAEEERVSGGSVLLAVLYDAIIRQQWANRALQCDPELNIPAAAQKLEKQVLMMARCRLDILLGSGSAGSGLLRGHGQDCGLASSAAASTYRDSAVAAESAMAKSTSAAQALTKRAEQAAKSLAQQQEELNRRQAAINAGGGSSGGGRQQHQPWHKAGGQQRQQLPQWQQQPQPQQVSNRERKRLAFRDAIQDKKQPRR